MLPAREFRAAYGSALRAHLAAASETSLRGAYELGRDAVVRELGVLELAAVHHETLLGALLDASDGRELARVTRAAGEFFLESLSAFEMVRRGLREAQDRAIAERRHSAMLRRLSSLLADTSLAVDGPDALAEALRLVAEEARELTNARWCVATAAHGKSRRLTEAVGDPERESDPSSLPSAAELARTAELVGAAGGPIRLSRAELATEPAFRALAARERGAGPRSWMAAPLRSLDGRELGSLQVFDKEEGDFTELDEEVLMQLAEMASAALERADLHRRAR